MKNNMISWSENQESIIIPWMTIQEVRSLPNLLVENILASSIYTNTAMWIRELIKEELENDKEIKQYQIEKRARINQIIKHI